MKTDQTAPLSGAACLSVLGTGSDVGKSIIAAALCRYFVDKGRRVAPFKAQNMSNNSGVTPEGLEMGRAQIVQAEAAKIPPHVDMNPILLKPTSDIGSQVVLLGKAVANTSAREYHTQKESLFGTAVSALERLRKVYDLVVMEGAGSCAEVNLMANDIVNFAMAEYARAPVILVADIHRGGVFAQIVGTLDVIPDHLRDLIAGFVINRFRGDASLFDEGCDWIEKKTGKPVFGVLPWYTHFSIQNEDSVVIESPGMISPDKHRFPAIAVIRIPHISNFTDFDPLMDIEGVNLYFIEKQQDLSSFSAVILPGSKNTCYDLNWLHNTGWSDRLNKFATEGGHLLGICGGYQMMGANVHDPHGTEGRPGTTRGLGLLPVETTLKAPKTTTLSSFSWNGLQGTGYEIHMGQTQRTGGRPLVRVTDRNQVACDDADGAMANEGRCLGTYMHGFFDAPAITRHWLALIGLDKYAVPDDEGYTARDKAYDQLAAHFTEHVDMEAITRLIR